MLRILMNKNVGLAYGCYPKKIAQSIKCDIKEATAIWNNYNQKLYPNINLLKEQVLRKAQLCSYIPLGLGCRLYSSNVMQDSRTIFNAYTQFWDVITLLAVNKLFTLIDKNNMQDKIEIVSTIYDAIYLNVVKNPEVIFWLNKNIIKVMTTDIFCDTIVHNSAEGEIGYNWADTVHIPNDADIPTIKHCLEELDGLHSSEH